MRGDAVMLWLTYRLAVMFHGSVFSAGHPAFVAALASHI